MAGLNGGGFVVTWMSDHQTGSSYDIYEQTFSASGAPVGGETLVNTTTSGIQGFPSVAALSDGGYEVTWTSLLQDGSGWGVYGQRFDASGASVGGETLINTTTTSDQMSPSVAGLSGGGDVVAWMSDGQDGSGWGVYDKVFAPSVATLTSTAPAIQPPVAVADTASATEAVSVNHGAPGVSPSGNVLANDTDPNGDALTVSAVSHGTTTGAVGTALAGDYGTLTLNADGSYTYAVDNADSAVQALTNTGQSLTDTFSYTAQDTAGAAASTTLTVTIQGADEALPEDNTVAKNKTLAVAASNGVLANDPNGNHLTVSEVDGSAASVGHAVSGQYGVLTLNADGSYTYAANANASAKGGGVPQDVFTFEVSDGHGGTATSTLTLTVTSSGSTYMQAAPGAETLVAGSKPAVLVADTGTDVLIGGSGPDTLIAGGGSATMTGGGGGDLFVFGSAPGHDVVTDFKHPDQVQFSQSDFSGYSQMMSHAAQVGADVVITIDPTDTVTLLHTSLTSLSSSDFLFV